MRQHEGVAAQAGGGIKNAGPHAGLEAGGTGDHLAAAAAELAPMTGRAADEVDMQRAGRVGGQFA